MGVGRIAGIVERLVAGGLDPATPAAAVQWGTRPEQRTVRATLGTLPDQELAPPSVIVIGHVAASSLDWFESRPLLGRRVVVTRPRHQASTLARRLRAEGAEAIEVPTIEIVDPADGGAALRAAAAEVASYDWVVLTSANGASRLCDQLRDGRDLAGVKLAAIGPGTAEVLAERNLVADLVPERYVAESLLEAFPLPHGDHGGRVLLARAEVARDVLPAGAVRAWAGRSTSCPPTGRCPRSPTPAQRERVAAADVVTFTSSSTVERWLEAFGDGSVPPVVACIGPVTADTARRLGLRVDVVADVHTVDGLVDALVASATGRPQGRGRRRRA